MNAVRVYLIPFLLGLGGAIAVGLGVLIQSRTVVVCGATVALLGVAMIPDYRDAQRRKLSREEPKP